jgi:uncharacterized membrane protein YfcA
MVTALLLGLAALVIGYSKNAIGGMAVIAVAIFASVMPARASTGAILAVLLVGDLVAIWHYRRDGDWHLVRQLVPTVLPGLALGALFLRVVDDTWLRRSIGGLLLVLVLLQLVLNSRAPYAAGPSSEPGERPAAPWAGWATGMSAGFVTMTANAAGAVMTLFLIARGVEKRRFVGTAAWFFFGVNVCKVPFSVGLGLLDWADVRRALWLAPLVILGGWLGQVTMRRISQRGFERAVLLASAASAVVLLVR